MRLKQQRSAPCRAVLLLALLGSVSVKVATAQTQDNSPSGLIRLLTRPTTLQAMMGLDACGSAGKHRTTAMSLASLGAAAIPEIEIALDSVEKYGESSEFAFNTGWLLLAYSRIEGSAAFPRLLRMIGNPKLASFGLALDAAAALSLYVTSYVAASHPPMRIFHCSRSEDPRDSLNQLTLAWERDDRAWVEASLGPRAATTLNSSLKEKPWAQLRTDLWHGTSGRGVAVGYRFDVPGRWSEPEETLDEERNYTDAALFPENFGLVTHFKTRSGADCGAHRVIFVKSPGGVGPGYLNYLVDNPDLTDLLRVISSCATDTTPPPGPRTSPAPRWR